MGKEGRGRDRIEAVLQILRKQVPLTVKQVKRLAASPFPPFLTLHMGCSDNEETIATSAVISRSVSSSLVK